MGGVGGVGVSEQRFRERDLAQGERGRRGEQTSDDGGRIGR